MPRADRQWVPIDVNFWDHPQIEDVGEGAAILYQRLISHAWLHNRDGIVPLRQPRAWHDDWKPRLQALIDAGLVTTGDRNISIVDWDKWHEPADVRAERTRRRREQGRARQQAWRERKSHNALSSKSSKNEELEHVTRVEGHSVTNASRNGVTNGVTPNGRNPLTSGAVGRWLNHPT